jgi:hypothetical protein
VGFAFYLRQALEPPRLGADFCPVNGDLPAHVVIVIDQSDPFASGDVQWVDRVITDVARRVPRGGRVSLMALRSDTPYDQEAVFTGCSPGSPALADPRYENPEMIRVAWETHLVNPLREHAAEILRDTAQPQPTSPLIEAITGIRDRADFQDEVRDRRIVILSDLVQNSADFSFFQSGVSWGAFQRSRLGGDDIAELEDVAIEIRLVPRRSDRFTDRELRAFWRQFGEASGAEVVYR